MNARKLSIYLYLLQQAQLEFCYHHASQEVDNIFEITNLDGLEENEIRLDFKTFKKN